MNILTFNKKITDRQRRAFWLAVVLINFFAQFLWESQSLYSIFISPFICFALNVISVGIYMRKRIYKQKKIYILALCFLGWYVICCIGNGSFRFEPENTFKTLVQLLSSWALALPFVTANKDFEKKRALTVLFSILTVLFIAAVWAALIPTFMGSCFFFPIGEKIFGIVPVYSREYGVSFTYPVIFGLYYYYTAHLCALAFFMALYLFIQKKMRPLMLFGMFGFVLALSLTKCRLALLGFGLVLFTFGFFLFRNKNRDASTKKTILAGVVIALAVALCLTLMWQFGTRISKVILAGKKNEYLKRTFSNHLLDGSGRLRLWAMIPEFLKDQAPTSYLFGIRSDVLSQMIENRTKLPNIHSGYFTALMRMGIPGFLLTLTFAFMIVKNTLFVFLQMKKRSIRNDDLLLLSIPLCLLFTALGEPVLFVGYVLRIITLIFYIVAGYVFELTDRIREEELSCGNSECGIRSAG